MCRVNPKHEFSVTRKESVTQQNQLPPAGRPNRLPLAVHLLRIHGPTIFTAEALQLIQRYMEQNNLT
jgi:hypothetical protein